MRAAVWAGAPELGSPKPPRSARSGAGAHRPPERPLPVLPRAGRDWTGFAGSSTAFGDLPAVAHQRAVSPLTIGLVAVVGIFASGANGLLPGTAFHVAVQ